MLPTVEDNLGLVHTIARKYLKNNEKVEDSEVYAEALVALWKAIEKYKPERPWSPYASRVISNRINRYVKYSKRIKRSGIFEDSVILEEISQKKAFKKLDKAVLEVLLADDENESDFDKANKVLLKEIFLNKRKASELAAEYKLTKASIYQRVNKAIVKIQEKHRDLIENLNEDS